MDIIGKIFLAYKSVVLVKSLVQIMAWCLLHLQKKTNYVPFYTAITVCSSIIDFFFKQLIQLDPITSSGLWLGNIKNESCGEQGGFKSVISLIKAVHNIGARGVNHKVLQDIKLILWATIQHLLIVWFDSGDCDQYEKISSLSFSWLLTIICLVLGF